MRLPEPARGEVVFDGVRFAYPTRPQPFVLDGVSFRVEPGERVALVGPSGAGKSTIFHLLLRFYDPAEGRIAYDGVDVAKLGPTDLRRHVAIVPQDVVVFAASVADNIRFGRPEATDADVERAADLALVTEFVRPAAAGLRHTNWRAGRHAIRRATPAHRDRARHPPRCASVAAR